MGVKASNSENIGGVFLYSILASLPRPGQDTAKDKTILCSDHGE